MTDLETELTSGLWQFGHSGGPAVSQSLRFIPDGTISGYKHQNEARWALVDGMLHMLSMDASVTSILDPVVGDDGRLSFRGASMLVPRITIEITRAPNWNAPHLPFSTRKLLAEKIRLNGWTVGDHTYGLPKIFEETAAPLTIGRFTSIAEGTVIALGDHSIRHVSTYPFSTLRANWPGAAGAGPDHATRGPVSIGNDVWIGANSFIGSGVTIGDGAVVGAMAVVTRSVPPFAIVVGNPGRVVRYRFPAAVCSRLLSIAWWAWPDDIVDKFIPMICADDISGFFTAIEQNREMLSQRGLLSSDNYELELT